MLERREGEPRDRCKITARLQFEHGRSIGCIIEDISAQGAKLWIDTDVAVPKFFTLQVPSGDGAYENRKAELRWHVANALGVSFLAQSDAHREKHLDFVARVRARSLDHNSW